MLASTKIIKVLLVDSCANSRDLLHQILAASTDIQVVGSAKNGRQAIEMARQLQPDLITMDLEMPVMSGVEAIDYIMHSKALPILVVSELTDHPLVYQALEKGALDVVAKPTQAEQAEINQQLLAKVRLLAGVSVITRMRSNSRANVRHHLASVVALTAPKPVPQPLNNPIFAIAASTGGPKALANLLTVLPENFPAPIVIAQHISHGFAEGMVRWLTSISNLPVNLAEEGVTIQPGQVYLSPSEKNLTLTCEHKIRLQEPVATDIYHPSCDAMLTSIAEVFGSNAVGIIMTGMGSDGTRGMAAIQAYGGITLAQDEASSVIYGMNATAVAAGVIHVELPLASLAEEMLKILLLKPAGYLSALQRGEL